MADPTVATLTRDTWVKVASGVTAAVIDIRCFGGEDVYQTYRMAGNAAPTLSPTNMTGDAIICDTKQQMVSTAYPIDVYMYAFGYETTARVSL